MSAEWYCRIDGTDFGPVAAADLKRMAAGGRLGPADLVRKADGKWAPAKAVKGLSFPAPAVTDPQPPAPEPPPDPSCPACGSTGPAGRVICIDCGYDFRSRKRLTQTRHKAGNKTTFLLAGGAAGLLVVAGVVVYLFAFNGGAGRGGPAVAEGLAPGDRPAPLGGQPSQTRAPQNTRPEAPEPGAPRAGAAWAKQVASTIERRDVLEVIGVRQKDGRVVETCQAWMTALKGRISDEAFRDLPLNVVLFLPRYDPIWKDDVLQPAASAQRVDRLRFLTRDVIGDWQRDLERVHKDGVSELWAAAWLADMDRLFGPDGFRANESTALRGRLAGLPDGSVESLAKLLKTGKARAAVLTVQNDEFFPDGRFSAAAFEGAMTQLNELVRASK